MKVGRRPVMDHYGSFESTKIHGAGTDILATTFHDAQWREDLDRLASSGIRKLRYPAPWHRVEKMYGVYDWSWLDGPLRKMRELQMDPVIDPLHHTSFPDCLTDGFANPAFPSLYARFVRALICRYPWIRRYTPFNEPLPTTLFCSHSGMWYPHRQSDVDFIQMTIQVAKAIALVRDVMASDGEKRQLVYVDTCEHHIASEPAVTEFVDFLNYRRFLFPDLLLGWIDCHHPLFPYLIKHGASDRDLKTFAAGPTTLDVLGLDYYIHSEMDWRLESPAKYEISVPAQRPRGFASVAKDYAKRYSTPLMLSETNIRGTIDVRLTWLKYMESECESLVDEEIAMNGFCWFPSIDSTDWCYCCTRSTAAVDPQGIWMLDESRRKRVPTELSRVYTALALGEIRAIEIPQPALLDSEWRQFQGYRASMVRTPRNHGG